MFDLQPSADQMATVVAGIRDDQLDAPTPCADTSVRQLVGHVVGLAVAFRDAAHKVDGPTTSTPPDPAANALPERWRELAPIRLAELVTAWRESEAWEGMTQVGGQTLPGAVGGQNANNELLLHAWDLAKATGQPFSAAEPNLQSSWEMVSNTPDDPNARHGLFGPVVEVAADAPLLDRTLAHSGRDPHWTP